MMTKLLSGMRLLFVTGINLQAHIAAYQCYFTNERKNERLGEPSKLYGADATDLKE